MKKVFLLSVCILLTACQNYPQQSVNQLTETMQNNEVAPCGNGFDDVNVCQLKS